MPRSSAAASRQAAAPVDCSPPPFSAQRSVPASQRFSCRPASNQPDSSAAADDSDGEAAKQQPATRSGGSGRGGGDSTAQAAKRPHSAISQQRAARGSSTSSAASKRQATAAAQRSGGKGAAASERDADSEWEPEEAEVAQRQPTKVAKGRKQTALKGKTGALLHKKDAAAPEEQQSEAAEEQAETSVQPRQQQKGLAKAARPVTSKAAQPTSKQPPAKPQEQRSAGAIRAATVSRVAQSDELQSEAVEKKPTKERTASKPSVKGRQHIDTSSAEALLQAFNGDVDLPDIDLPVARKGGERAHRAEEKQPTGFSRGGRPAKQVRSGLDATAELHCQPKPEDKAAKQTATAAGAGRRGKAEEDGQTREEQGVHHKQQRTATRRRTRSDGGSEQAASGVDEQQAAAEISKQDGCESAAADSPVPLTTLQGQLLLISAKPGSGMHAHHEKLAKELGAQVTSQLSSEVSHVVWDDGDEELLERIDGMTGSKPYVVSEQWLNATAANNAPVFESVYPINRHGNMADEEDEQQRRPAEADTAVDAPQKTRDSAHSGSPQQADATEAKADTPQPLADGGLNNAPTQAAEQQPLDTTAEQRTEAEPLKPGWSRKKSKQQDWAETDPVTQSLTQFEKDAAAEKARRAAEGASQEIDDADMAAAADDGQSWVDEDEEELKRERKKVDRRFLRDRERKQKRTEQGAPIHHNHRNERLGMVRFEPHAFDEDAIQDSSERHALLSPLTDEEQESGLESGSSSEFECSDLDSSGDDSSGSSDDPDMAELVDDRYDEKRAKRRKDKKEQKTRTARKKSARLSSDEQESDEEWVGGRKPVAPRRRTPAASTKQAATGEPQKKERVPTVHKVAPSPARTEKNSIAFSALAAEKATLSRIAQHLLGFHLVADEDDTADHVVVDRRQPTRTRKVLFGIARGSWILDRSWLLEYVDKDGRLINAGDDGMVEPYDDEASYCVDHWPGAVRSRLLLEQGGLTQLVFNHSERIFVAHRTALARPLVEQLIWLVGGQPAPDYFSGTFCCVCADDFTTADLGDQFDALPPSAFGQPIVTTEWLFDCISDGVRKPFDGYTRYPRQGADEDEHMEVGSPAI